VPAVRRSVSLAAALLVLALPAAAPAQTPGDEQYTDPFGGEQEQPSQGGGSQGDDGGQPEPAPAPEPEPAAPAAPEPAAATTAQASAAEQLPRTGSPADAGLLALGGTLLLAGGVALRLRVSERRPPRP
jgi:LPXTG-motif cell wall-anchored protein